MTQKFFISIAFLSFVYGVFMLLYQFDIIENDFVKLLNDWSGGVGGILFAFLSGLVGSDKEGSARVVKNVTNAFNQIGLITISVGNNYDNPASKKEEDKK